MKAIITYPNSILRKKSKIISAEEIASSRMKAFVSELKKRMHSSDGIGIAAPQIGENIRVIVVRHFQGDLVAMNPKLSKFSWKKSIEEEGCLSVPGVSGVVKRSQSVRVSALDENGKPFSLRARGLLARVFQHEVDHLDGVLFIDKVISITKGYVPAES